MKTLITAACLCVIGWTTYFAGGASLDWLERRQVASAAAAAQATRYKDWSGCMDRMYQPPQVTSVEAREALCEQMGYFRD